MFSDPQFWVAIAFIIFILAIFNPVRKILNSSLDTKINEIKESIEEAENLKNDTQVILSEIKKRQNEVELEIKTEIERLESERQEYELLIGDTLQKNKWLNWIDRYSKKIDKYRDTKDKELMKEVFGEVLQKIFVDWDVDTKEHILDIRLKLPLFNDKIEYIDNSNKSLGYKLKDGKKSKELRYKKTNNVKRFIEKKKKI